jgi:hypothetical protein
MIKTIPTTKPKQNNQNKITKVEQKLATLNYFGK